MTIKYKNKNKMLKELWSTWIPFKKGQKAKFKRIMKKYRKK